MSGGDSENSGAPPNRADVIAELTALRMKGLVHARSGTPTLLACCALAGIDGSEVSEQHGAAVERLLRQAIDRLDDAKMGLVAEYTFGLKQGTRFWTAHDRRRAAANEQSVSVERFRKGYEPQLIEFVADEVLYLCSVAGQASVPSPPSGTGTSVDDLSRSLMKQLGRRRTAYPLDMSLEELAQSNLLVQTKIARYAGKIRTVDQGSITDIVEALSQRRSCLLLGEPGAGKSLASYWVATECRRLGIVPIVVRAQDADVLLSSQAWAEAAPSKDIVFVLDGLDEAVLAWERTGLPQRVLDAIATTPCLITSRRREFEESAILKRTEIAFDAAYVLQDWSVEVEFEEYLRKLVEAGLLSSMGLYEHVRHSEALTKLVSRPLFARMLTFIGHDDFTEAMADANTLYGEYLVRLSRAADAALERRGLAVPQGALAVWKEASWIWHVTGNSVSGTADVETIVRELADQAPADCVRGALAHVLDVREVNGRMMGEFVHYSFFEYLLASHVFDRLSSISDPLEALELLRYDLSREVRHFLTVQLKASPNRNIERVLTQVLTGRADDTELTEPERLSALNLAAYLLSRAFSQTAMASLEEVLDKQDDPFMRISVLSALCHLGSRSALRDFVGLLEESPLWGALSRGYSLYYYGDLPRDTGPPYVDDPPYSLHLQTFEQVVALISGPDYRATVRPERRFTDIYTLLDILRVRAVQIDEPTFGLLAGLIRDLREDGLDESVIGRLTTFLHNRRG